jgi:hypothetical protein
MSSEQQGCKFCRYVLASPWDTGPGYNCTCESSPHFAEDLGIRGAGPGCECYKKSVSGDMSLLEAMKTLTCSIGYPGYPFFMHRLDEEDKPYFAVMFDSNEQLENWRDAITRLFEETMRLMKENGELDEK